MGVGINVDALPNIAATTLNKLPENKFTLELDNQHSEASIVFAKDATIKRGGTRIEDRISFDDSGQARMRGMYGTDTPKGETKLFTMLSPWNLADTHALWDVFELLTNATDPEGFIDLMAYKVTKAKESVVNLLDDQLFGVPVDSSDELNFRGIFYHMNVANNAVTTDGFQGQTIRFSDGTTSTTNSNIDASTQTKYRNYTILRDHAAADAVFNNTLVRQIRDANMQTSFFFPNLFPDPSGVKTMKKRVYANFEDAAAIMEYLDAKNDNHQAADDAVGGVVTRNHSTGVAMIGGYPVIPLNQMAFDSAAVLQNNYLFV